MTSLSTHSSPRPNTVTKLHHAKNKPFNLHLADLDSILSNDDITVIHPTQTQAQCLRIPIYSSKVEAGFASPADDFVEEYLDLNNLLVKHHEATFFVRVSGKSMVNAGIYPDDILIVDRSITATDGKVVIANVDGDVMVKRLSLQGDKVILKSENPKHKDISVTGELTVWGVVTSVIHQM